MPTTSKLNIVVVEDHDLLRHVTVDLLTRLGHQVIGLDCAEALDDEAGHLAIDLLIVDLNLPGEDGLSLARRFRRAQPRAGIIMVTARTEVTDRVSGYENGADIYLSKPVEPAELKAAVQSLERRLSSDRHSAPSLPHGGDLKLDQMRMRLTGQAGEVELSHSESAMLATLARAASCRLEYWQLIELVGGDPGSYDKSALEVRMVRLRKKLQQAGADENCLKAVRRWGYQLCAPVSVV